MSPIDTLLWLAAIWAVLPIVYGCLFAYDYLRGIATRVLHIRRARRERRRMMREFTILTHPANYGRCFVSGEVRK